MDAKQATAEETLADIRATLKRWDDAKERFGDALKAAAHRIADAMRDQVGPEAPAGPPTGVTAHGFLTPPDSWADPVCITYCDSIARPNMSAQLPAHEYNDTPEVLAAKVRVLADLMRRAQHTVVYTGAGISTAAGIKDYASKAGGRSKAMPKTALKGDPFNAGEAINAQPTFTHQCITAGYEAGYIHEWVQQNHDGLAGKSGFPQEALNPIHGEWHDPSNPVVPMSGRLRSDLVRRLRQTCEECDLVVAMGTSLSGVAADTVASSVAYRAKAEAEAAEPRAALTATSAPKALGAVIINLQQTRLDASASLRIFADLDSAMRALAAELKLEVPRAEGKRSEVAKGRQPSSACDTWTELPYDPETGQRLQRSNAEETGRALTLRLNLGSAVKLAHGNPPLASEGLKGVVGGKTHDGHYMIDWEDGRRTMLGRWFMQAAQRGGLERLPVVNVA